MYIKGEKTLTNLSKKDKIDIVKKWAQQAKKRERQFFVLKLIYEINNLFFNVDNIRRANIAREVI